MFPTLPRLALSLTALLALVPTAIAVPTEPQDTTAALKAAVDGAWRSPPHKARDIYRHPVETLQFFGIQPGMTVIELQPGAGWYTEIIAPFLYAHGHLMEASGPKFAATMKADPAV
ncbi:MAG TPA: hypothetical protein VK753_12250, partial [Xanthomonadaceae bacterium]|nr:hypothetical protein [Xanthomonadaceae bacterium]